MSGATFRHPLRAAAVWILATALLLLCADAASAQARRRTRVRRTGPPRAGSIEVSGGVVWSGGFQLPARTAEETRNIGTDSSPFALFTTRSRLASAPGAQGRLGVFLTRSLVAEAGFRYARPVLTVRTSADAEQAPDISATETLSEYVVDGSLLLHLGALSFAHGRGVPFVAGGAGYIRDLHEGSQLIETGTEYHALGGLKFWLGNMGVQHLGIRGEAGVSIRDGGFGSSDRRRTAPIVSASVFYVF